MSNDPKRRHELLQRMAKEDKEAQPKDEGLTFKDLRGMTEQEINDNWDEVQEVMTKGPTPNA